jgi:putative oxidoreductase
MKFDHPAIPFLGRLFMTYIFATSGIAKIFSWDANIAYISTRHLPFTPVLLAIALVIEVGGSICLITGYQARTAAIVMFAYMVFLTVLFHNYWGASGMLAGMQETHFRKNLAIMGGLLMIGAFGPGKWAIQRRVRSTHDEPQRALSD